MISLNHGLVEGLTHCLDVAWMREVVNQEIDWPDGLIVKDVRIRRFTFRPRQSFDFEFEIDLDGLSNARSAPLSLFGRLPQLDTPVESRRATLTNGRVVDILAHLPDADATLHTMDRDPGFPRFDECIDAAGIAGIIDEMYQSSFGSEAHLRPTVLRSRMVSFRCGRRFVVRYDDDSSADSGSAWAGKFYADDRGGRLTRRHRRLSELLCAVGDGALGVPQVVGYDADLHMTVTHWNAEPPTNGSSMESAMVIARRAGEAISVLQSLPIDDAATTSVDRDRQQLQRWRDCVVTLRGDLARTAAGSLQTLEAARDALAVAAPVTCHGDFYQDQLVIGERRTTLLDLDTLSIGHPCMDLGNFLAHQWLWCLQHGYALEQYSLLAQTAINAYECNGREAKPSALNYFWASTLFRVGALHAFRCATAQYTPALWNLIEPILLQGCAGIDGERARSQRRA